MFTSTPTYSREWWPSDPAMMVSSLAVPGFDAAQSEPVKASSSGKAIDAEEAKREAEKLLTGLTPRKVVPKGGNGK